MHDSSIEIETFGAVVWMLNKKQTSQLEKPATSGTMS